MVPLRNGHASIWPLTGAEVWPFRPDPDRRLGRYQHCSHFGCPELIAGHISLTRILIGSVFTMRHRLGRIICERSDRWPE